ncbi:membrane fusion protein [Silvimonas terrae]|uniref:Membrane fusion protein n=1 Tax=Silvimonas terrae TaxID=300266 RepID=A0A840RAJ8_9NEIS|nr:HlyD family efflux transporter periplasmic adaptor subunit [Silvimonas terrae]MBB5189476.1 membrane fusion protein [Silvimonas terrae]
MTSSKNHLYRQDFVDAQKLNQSGVILIPIGMPLTIFAMGSVMLLLALVAFLTWGSYTRKAHLDGLVMPSTGVVRVMARNEGRIEQLFVQEGQSVGIGAPLYRLDDEKYDGNVIGSAEELAQSVERQQMLLTTQQQQQQYLNRSQSDGLSRRDAELKAQLESARASHALAMKQMTLIQETLAPYEQLAKQGYVSAMDWQQKRIDLTTAESRVQEALLRRQQLEQALTTNRTEIARIQHEGQIQKSESDRQFQVLKQQKIELATRAKTTITAPVTGIVAAIMARPGQIATGSDPMLIIVPGSAHMQVELYAPSKAVGFIKAGERVGLRFAAYPFEKFGVQYGRIKEVSKVALAPTDIVLRTPFSWKENEAHYRVVVTLDKATVTAYGKEEPLKVGMAVSGDVDLDSRHIYEWALEPLWSLRGRI